MKNENKLPKRKELRIKQYDYSSRGAYFITICTKNREKTLSRIAFPVGVGALDDPPSVFDAQIVLTEIGQIVEKNLLSSENISGVTIDEYVIMPNHIHVIIYLDPDKYNNHTDGSSRAPTPTNEMIPQVVSAFKRFCNKELGQNIFQRGYMEHIIRDKADYNTRVKYIYENPMRWHFDKLYIEQ